MERRVVVTGMSGVTAFGNNYASVEEKLKACENAVLYMQSYEQYDGLNTKLAAPIIDFELPKHYTRKKTRGMGRVSKLATLASENALIQSGLLGNEILTSGQTGVAYGSPTASVLPVDAFGAFFIEHHPKSINW